MTFEKNLPFLSLGLFLSLTGVAEGGGDELYASSVSEKR